MKSYKNLRDGHGIAPALIALSFMFYGGFISACHHHEHCEIKDICPICSFQQYGNDAVAVDYTAAAGPSQFVVSLIVVPHEMPIKPAIFSSTRLHAPPLCS